MCILAGGTYIYVYMGVWGAFAMQIGKSLKNLCGFNGTWRLQTGPRIQKPDQPHNTTANQDYSRKLYTK